MVSGAPGEVSLGHKAIPSALHNFGHSFASAMNVLSSDEDRIVLDVILECLPRRVGAELTVSIPEGVVEAEGEVPECIAESARRYGERLPGHLQGHGVSPEAVRDLHLVFSLAEDGLHLNVRARDDRGGTWDVPVRVD